ncbi:MAG: 16S rRNA (adenine(1518)-N(6)/adenine(1519)-N(6))-dimethyltransferase RsmA [Desulfocapsaceae bacterium]|nr:16S rRNA (adenine(1518)-N(6)/adenine(1519)-N(6))-dimethyltransferase RsmA [Desulfocapsaceae bacterium]
MTAYSKTRQALQDHSLTPKKRFGQNFLVHRRTAEAIVRAGEVCKEDTIVEVGVGLGALTIPIAEAAGQVFGLEIDSGIIRLHQEERDLPANVTLIHADVLKSDFGRLAEQCGGPLKIMANLPYSISNPFLFKLIENRERMAWATIMLQKEVAERLTAPPGTKEYGVPTVMLQSCATVRTLMTLKPAEFHPRPKIDSVVVRIDFSPVERLKGLPGYDHAIFRRIVRAAFGQRRKTLLNALCSAELFGFLPEKGKAAGKELTGGIIQAAGLAPDIRAEVLALEDYIHLAIETSRLIDSLSAGQEEA